MSDIYSSDKSEPKKQLESGDGGSGRKQRTAVGTGDNDDSDRPNFGWIPSDEPKLGHSPRTVICDSNDLLRAGLKAMIESFVTIVGDAKHGMEAMELIRQLRPDLFIFDVDLDNLAGLEVCRRAVRALPELNALVFTYSFSATKYYNQLARAGARGFVLKSSGPQILFKAIEQVTRSLPYCDPEIMQLLKQHPWGAQSEHNLTDREIEVLIRLDQSNKEISEELDMKLITVEKHIECILQKLKAATRIAAALRGAQLGYRLLPVMPNRGISEEQLAAEKYAEQAIRLRSSRNPSGPYEI